jgi:hypothetical protein
MEKFMGILVYIGKFIPIKAQLLTPLRETIERTLNKKTGKKGKRTRNENDTEARAAFETIKELITGDKIIVNPILNEPVEIYTDASDYGIGGVLKQKHGIIAYYGRTFKINELKWTIPRKELYGIYRIVKDNINLLQLYTPGMIKIFCDSQVVVSWLNSTTRDVPIEKTALKVYWQIVTLGLTVQHIKGKENMIADALSRFRKKIDELSSTEKQENKVTDNHNTVK